MRRSFGTKLLVVRVSDLGVVLGLVVADPPVALLVVLLVVADARKICKGVRRLGCCVGSDFEDTRNVRHVLQEKVRKLHNRHSTTYHKAKRLRALCCKIIVEQKDTTGT